MFPSFTVFGKEISMYMLMTVLGSFALAAVVFGTAKKEIYRRDQLLHIMLAAAGGAFLGAHLLFFFTRLSLLREVASHFSAYVRSFRDFLNVLASLFGGMVFYGGLLGALIGGLLYCRSLKLDPLLYLDLFVPGIPLFHMFARFGCLFAGCCFGVESEHGWYFPHSPLADPNTRYFPIQLVEAGGNLLLFLLLLALPKAKIPKGRMVWIYFSLYAVMRFTLEFWRGDAERGIYGGLSTSQWVSIFLLLLSACVFLRDFFRRGKQNAKRGTA